MSLPTSDKEWILKQQPEGQISIADLPETFELKDVALAPPGEASVLVKLLTLSNDPAQRTWIRKGGERKKLYVKPLVPGDTIHTIGIAKVIATGKSAKMFKVGDLVYGWLHWAEYTVCKEDDVFALDAYLGTLGFSGFTAYTGLHRVLKFQTGQTLVVSGAAGSVGTVVVQNAKKVLQAGKVVAIAGSKEKCDWLLSIGADVALNYKSPNFKVDVAEAAPEGANKFSYLHPLFADISCQIFRQHSWANTRPCMKNHGRIAACGAVVAYNSTGAQTFENFFDIVSQRINLKGFICTDWMDMWPQFQVDITKAIQDGKVMLGEGTDTVVDLRGKFEDIPKVWLRLSEGGN
ncbi:NAD P-binding protein [Gloeophyllum trabeum ATCC 11539]|uniref:NAD P-binding protein n=1 Tax=Gloeophyllum trabeum (strain ATCC 11539 / FP-39264 / Madison 617) TaxID=670483 RepID=S7Q3R5_GLOTA|nr:NAD P-binding protein [Gloeophyllum trabeum ATCC 11539]EPQ54068.1 NAD P-binding protein [Gloeophyllum trabeum ATCC 11539]